MYSPYFWIGDSEYANNFRKYRDPTCGSEKWHFKLMTSWKSRDATFQFWFAFWWFMRHSKEKFGENQILRSRYIRNKIIKIILTFKKTSFFVKWPPCKEAVHSMIQCVLLNQLQRQNVPWIVEMLKMSYIMIFYVSVTKIQ